MSDELRTSAPGTFHPRAIERPDPALMKYYLIASLGSLCAFPIVILPLIARYRTLRYRFDDEGIFMSWGLFFRRETNLTYRRIQDIHLTRNLLERWMGLAKVTIQTAAGSASPVMTIEGVLQAAELRDFLYTKMRGAKAGSDAHHSDVAAAAGVLQAVHEAHGDDAPGDEALKLLIDIRDELRRLRAGRT